MKQKRFNLFSFFLFLLLICAVLLGKGCKDIEQDLFCYQGKVVTLNQGEGCNNIIEIIEPAKNGELSAGVTISFDPNLYSLALEVGDVVSFKIVQYEEWVGPATADCLWPQYIAQIDFCDN